MFNWDPQTQGIVLGAFYYGYAATQIISGTVAQKIGGKLLILVGLSWMSLLTLLTPVITTAGGFGALFVVRLLEGMGAVCHVTNRYSTSHSIYRLLQLKVELNLRSI